MQFTYLMCRFEFVPRKKGKNEASWKFIESVAMDDDGYQIGPSKFKGGTREFDTFLYKKSGYDNQPILGRAATIWSLHNGVRLHTLHPPKWSQFLSPTFYEELPKLHNWVSLITAGHQLYFKTSSEVEKMMKS